MLACWGVLFSDCVCVYVFVHSYVSWKLRLKLLLQGFGGVQKFWLNVISSGKTFFVAAATANGVSGSTYITILNLLHALIMLSSVFSIDLSEVSWAFDSW